MCELPGDKLQQATDPVTAMLEPFRRAIDKVFTPEQREAIRRSAQDNREVDDDEPWSTQA